MAQGSRLLFLVAALLVALAVLHVLYDTSSTAPDEPRQTVAVIGLGIMGAPMAQTLARAGFRTLVWNRTPGKALQHAAAHGSMAVEELSDLSEADVVITSLPSSVEVASIADQMVPVLRPGTLWLDTTSGSPSMSQEISAKLQNLAGVSFLDTPVSGGPGGAGKGKLTIMAGGTREAFESAATVLAALGPDPILIGGVGSAHALKAANNAMLATHIWAAGEAIAMAMKFGVNATDAVRIINKASGFSAATNGIFPGRILNREFPKNFGLGMMEKDVRIAVESASSFNLKLPVLETVLGMWEDAKKEFGSDVDCSEAIKLIEHWAGVPIQ